MTAHHFPSPHLFQLSFDIDDYLNRFVPRNRLSQLPQWSSWFLGYRQSPRPKPGSLLILFYSFLGAFTALILISGVIKSSSVLQPPGEVLVIGSFGAAAILEFNTIESPFSQPRNSILGHVLSAFVGVTITKLFALNPTHFESLRWVAGALACGVASVAMGVTKTTHPPAGATALLAAIDPRVSVLGWNLLPLVLVSSLLMLGAALVVNNLQRQFPVYWWTPADVGPGHEARPDIERTASHRTSSVRHPSLDMAESDTIEGGEKSPIDFADTRELLITTEDVHVPDWLFLAEEEREVLEVLRDRLREWCRQQEFRRGARSVASGEATHVAEPKTSSITKNGRHSDDSGCGRSSYDQSVRSSG